MRALFLLLGVCSVGQAAMPTIACQEANRSFKFEEGIDSYVLQVRTYANELGVLAEPFELKTPYQSVSMRVRLPRLAKASSVMSPNCLFDPDEPFLFNCKGDTDGKVEISAEGKGQAKEYTSFQVSVEQVSRKGLAYNSETASVTEFLVLTLNGRPAPEPPKYFQNVKSEITFPMKSCSVGKADLISR
ncbi:hypothetical protein K2X33_13515 [bacterium]|nr:hypothetical protein [bacterium]